MSHFTARIIIQVILCAACVVFLTACGGGGGGGDDELKPHEGATNGQRDPDLDGRVTAGPVDCRARPEVCK